MKVVPMHFIERIKRRIFKLFYTTKSLLPPTEIEKDCIRELRERITNLPDLKISSGSQAEINWINYRNNIRRQILNEDPRDFLNWSAIKNSMFFEPPIGELNFLKKMSSWDLYNDAIIESRVGNCRPYYAFKKSSGNLIHHAYNLAQLEVNTSFSIPKEKVLFELGGGYGSFCRLCYNLGFSGTYVIFDFPEFLALQKYFLDSLNVHVQAEYYQKGNKIVKNQIVLISEFSDLEELFKSIENYSFVGTWSLSETPLDFRKKLFDILPDPRYFLIGYQKQFGEVSNTEYFGNMVKENKQYSWKNIEMSRLSDSNYLIGELRKEA